MRKTTKMKVLAGALNGRITPNTQFGPYTTKLNGEILDIIDGVEYNNWVAADMGDGVLWFHSDFLSPPSVPIVPAGTFAWRAWPTDYLIITQPFGANPEYYGQFGLAGHEGVDIRSPHGKPVRAIDHGEVYGIKLDRRKKADGGHNYGVHVRVRHADGFSSVYAHFDDVAVDNGDIVAPGDLLGYSDNTGNSNGSHLHLTLKLAGHKMAGYPAGIIDPTPYLTKFLEGNTVP